MEEYLQAQMNSLAIVPAVAEDPDIDERVLQELKQMVKKWTEVDGNIKKISRLLQGWRHMKSSYEAKITKFMQDNELEGLNTKDGLIQCCVTQRKKRMTRATLRERLEDNIVEPELRRKIIRLVCSGADEPGEAKVSLRLV